MCKVVHTSGKVTTNMSTITPLSPKDESAYLRDFMFPLFTIKFAH